MALIEVRERAAASSTCHPPQVGSAVPAPTTRKTSQSASCHGQALGGLKKEEILIEKERLPRMRYTDN